MPAKMKGAIEEKVRITGECVASGKNDGQLALKYSVSCQQVRILDLRFAGEAGLQDRRGRRKKGRTPRTELEQAQIEIERLKHKLHLSETENILLNWTRWRGEMPLTSKAGPSLYGHKRTQLSDTLAARSGRKPS